VLPARAHLSPRMHWRNRRRVRRRTSGRSFVYNPRFPGQYFDAETGLNYNYQRDYDPATGRYVESDPIGLHSGINTFAYAGVSPLMLIDPLGLAIYRGAGNYYSDIPPSGMCDQAVMAGDYVVGWIPCNFGTSYRHGCSSDYDYGHGGWPSTPASNGDSAGNEAGSPPNFPPLLSGAFAQTGTVSVFGLFGYPVGCTATGSTGTSGSSWYGGCGLGIGSFSSRPSWQGSLSTGNPTGLGVRANVSAAAFGGNGSFSVFLSPTGGVVTVGVGPGGSGASANFTGGYRTKSP
jgi:RHS repeat-associated protein